MKNNKLSINVNLQKLYLLKFAYNILKNIISRAFMLLIITQFMSFSNIKLKKK